MYYKYRYENTNGIEDEEGDKEEEKKEEGNIPACHETKPCHLDDHRQVQVHLCVR